VSTLRKWSAGDAVIVCTASGFEGGESQALGEVQGSTVEIPPSWLGRFAPAMSYISTLRWIEPPFRIELTTARLQDR
jgi:hypothetical protein